MCFQQAEGGTSEDDDMDDEDVFDEPEVESGENDAPSKNVTTEKMFTDTVLAGITEIDPEKDVTRKESSAQNNNTTLSRRTVRFQDNETVV